ncbi:S9 family peptidase [Croceibacterium soli]|nr:alpha/beta fold hydrolase [Croceibacterium soli]
MKLCARLSASLALIIGGLVAQSVYAAPPADRPVTIEQLLQQPRYRAVDFSPDGAWLAVESGSRTRSREIRLVDQASGRTIPLDHDERDARIAGWSPDGRYLAYAVDSGEPLMETLWIWDRQTGRSRAIEGAFIRGWRVRWFSDSRRLVAVAWPEGEKPMVASDGAATDAAGPQLRSNAFQPPFTRSPTTGASLHVFRANLPASASVQGNRAAMTPGAVHRCNEGQVGRCDIAVFHVEEGRIQRIARNVAAGYFHAPAPDGSAVAYAAFAGRDIRGTQENLYDLHLVDLASREDRILVPGAAVSGSSTFSWSPDGRFIAFPAARASEGNRVKEPLASIAIAPVAGPAPVLLELPDGQAVTGTESILWSADSSTVYAVGIDGGIWAARRDGRGARQVAAVDGVRLQHVVTPNEQDFVTSGQLWVTGGEPGAGSGLFAINAAGSARALIDPARGRLDTLDIDARYRRIVYAAGQGQTPQRLHSWSAGPPVRLPQDEPLAEVRFGQAQTINWRNAEGQELAGALLLPPTYRPGQRLPLVVWVYGGKMGSEAVDLFGFAGSGDPMANMQLLATRGYAVLFPDAPQRVGQPLADLVANVIPGVDALVAQGIADPTRVAAMGHSYGGYSVLALLTHSDRFRAAVITSPGHPDLLAMTLRLNDNGNSGERWTESGQGLMGVHYWQDPDLYRRNSPIHFFDRIRAPLLIGQGALDTIGPDGANATFVALRRLGQPVEYRVYEGEGHSLYRPASIIDFWNRRLEFLAEHLDIARDEMGRVILDRSNVRSLRSAGLGPSGEAGRSE